MKEKITDFIVQRQKWKDRLRKEKANSFANKFSVAFEFYHVIQFKCMFLLLSPLYESLCVCLLGSVVSNPL